MYAPTVPVLIKLVDELNPDTPKDQNVDIANAIINFMIYGSDLSGPLIGGFLCSLFGFSKTALFILFLYLIGCFILIRNFKENFLLKFEEAKNYFLGISRNKQEEIETSNKENLL